MLGSNKFKESRRLISLAIIAAVIATSVALGLTHRVQPGEIAVKAVSDGFGGAIVAWQDGDNIHTQRVDPEGKPLWGQGGVLVCGEPMQLKRFAITSDGFGGVIITWDDKAKLSEDREDAAFWAPIPVYSQRIGAEGEPMWGDTGIPTGGNQRFGDYLPQATPDGTGGAFITWNDFQLVYRALHDDYFRLQKISPEGNPLWGEKGVLLCSSSPYRPVTPEEKEAGVPGTWTRSLPTYSGFNAVSDGSGGAIVILREKTQTSDYNIYAQRVNAEGEFVWQDKGILVCTTDSSRISVTSNGMGGATIIWSTSDGLVCGQRIDAGGKLLEPGEGVSLWKTCYQIVSDELGGAIFLEQERYHPYGTNPRITGQVTLYAQRLDDEGKNLWQKEPLFTTEKGQWTLQSAIASDGSGGALITWRTWKKESNIGGRVYGQKLDAEGDPLWQEGLAVFIEPDLKYQGPPQVVSDGSGGAIVVAAVGRNALRGDMVYLQRLDANGNYLWGGGIKITLVRQSV